MQLLFRNSIFFKLFGLIVSLNLIHTTLPAQSFAFELLNGKEKVSIPFEYRSGYIILNVQFDQHLPLKLIFDTGAENTILFQKEITDLLQIPYVQTVKVQGPDLKKDIKAFVCRRLDFQLKNTPIVKRDFIVLETDFLELHKTTGFRINGIIGGSFFKGLTIKIDYIHQQLTLYDSRNMDPKVLKSYESIPINIKQSKVYINSRLEIKKGVFQNVDLLLDTGAALSILLYDDQQIQERDNLIPTGKMGVVVSGSLMGYLGRVHQLDLGNFKFNNLISNLIFQDSIVEQALVLNNKKGLVGNEVLSRFDVIIDFLNNQLYLKSNKQFEDEFEFDKSGIEIFATGLLLNEFLIHDVIKNSPAYFAKLKKGDIITKVNNLSTKKMKLNDIGIIFQGKIGKQVKLEILRDNYKIKKSFILFDYLLPVEQNQSYIWPDPPVYDFY